MAWSAAVRKDAPSCSGATPSPLPRLPLDSLRSVQEGNTGISLAVIDANALISFDDSARLLSLALSSSSSPPRFVSVKEVLDEVRAPASRFHLASLPCSVDIIEPTDESLQRVTKFSRETGDLHSLSDVDLKLLALTYMLEEQTYGSAHLRIHPPAVHVTQVRRVRERDLPGWGTNVQNLEEWEQLIQEPDEATEHESHILGLKKLLLDTSEQENMEERKHAPQEARVPIPPDTNLHGWQERSLHSPQEANEHGSQETIAHDFQDVRGLESKEEAGEEASGGAHNSFTQSLCRDERPAPFIRDAKELKEAEWKMEEEESQDGGDWQRSVSRSTRRKHEKRAARAASRGFLSMKMGVESIEGNNVCTDDRSLRSVCTDGNVPCPHNDQPCSIESNDEVEVAVDSAEAHLDELKSDEDCPSLSESSQADEQPVSVQQTESEESWMLRPLSQSKVACITADFPMQNVLLQMGLRIVSPNGLQVQQLHRWALKCEACRNVTSDVGRMFCPRCGNGGTLYKVSITIGPNGVVQTGTKKHTNIRGTKYSLPLPKGGRQGITENPILREDQLPQKMLRPKKKVSIPDLSSPAEIFAMKSGGKEKLQPPIREALAIFSGKRNPNRCRSKQRG